MQRHYKASSLDGGSIKKVTVQYKSLPCDFGTNIARAEAVGLLQTLSCTPGLLDCDSVGFETLTMKHDGISWIVTIEAITKD